MDISRSPLYGHRFIAGISYQSCGGLDFRHPIQIVARFRERWLQLPFSPHFPHFGRELLSIAFHSRALGLPSHSILRARFIYRIGEPYLLLFHLRFCFGGAIISRQYDTQLRSLICIDTECRISFSGPGARALQH